MADNSKVSHMPQLDTLRAFAVSLVICHHWVAESSMFGIDLGSTGVRLFFVISGFLITAILLRCRESLDKGFALRSFFARRSLRIFPLYYFALAVVFALNLPPAREHAVWYLGYLSNIKMFLDQQWHGCMTHFWSLAVEEQFYLFWPWLICFIPKRLLVPAVASLFLIGIATPYLFHFLNPGTTHVGQLTISCFDALGAGGLLAIGWKEKLLDRTMQFAILGFPLILSIKIALASGYRIPHVQYLVEQTALLMCLVWLVRKSALGFKGNVGKLVTIPAIMFLGQISYGIYVFHSFAPLFAGQLAFDLGAPVVASGGVIGFTVKLCFTLFCSLLTWTFLESPILRWKSSFPYKANMPSQESTDHAEESLTVARESKTSKPTLCNNRGRRQVENCMLALCVAIAAGIGIWLVWDSWGRQKWEVATKVAPAAEFDKENLVLWLDASDSASMEIEDGIVKTWKDLSGHGNDARNVEGGKPKLQPMSVAGHSAILFSGNERFSAARIESLEREVSIFVVCKRPVSSHANRKWQRLISGWDGKTQSDNEYPSFCVCSLADGDPSPFATTVVESHFNSRNLGEIGIGGAVSPSGDTRFYGLICEVLVFDHNFDSASEVERVRDYLTTKWKCGVQQLDEGWARVSDLESKPTRVSDVFPLSDQNNESGWILNKDLSDEFGGLELDSGKWFDRHYGWWHGRIPAYFNPNNVVVRDGMLNLTFRKDSEIPERIRALGYHTYSCACVSSRNKVSYGYFEIRAKPMNSAASSSFWLIDEFEKKDGEKVGKQIEIDVYCL